MKIPLSPSARFTVEVYGDQLTPEAMAELHTHLNESAQRRLSAHFSDARIVGIWNTGCRTVFNDTGNTIHIVDGEDSRYTLTLPPKGKVGRWAILPWCNSWDEVRRKAIRFYMGPDTASPVHSWFFQDYSSSMMCVFQGPTLPFGSYQASEMFCYPKPASRIDLAFDPNEFPNIYRGYPPFGPEGGFR